MLNIKIFDVDRGFCAVVHTDDLPSADRHQILIDCGYNSRSGFHPTRYLLENSNRRLNYSILSTFSEGCLAGLYELIGYSLNNCFSIDGLLVNPSINAESLPELIVRNFSTRNSLKFLSDVCKRSGNVERTVHLGEVELSFFWNTYPEFLDFHNLSLVTFVFYKNINIIFPGNLKTEGWRALLRNPRFRDRLTRVNLFVASKHGQADGYCSDVFNYCTPELIIISNRDRLASTIVSRYERHIRAVQKSSEQPIILTTHHAGTIAIQQSSNNSVQVITQRAKTYQLQQTEVYQA